MLASLCVQQLLVLSTICEVTLSGPAAAEPPGGFYCEAAAGCVGLMSCLVAKHFLTVVSSGGINQIN